MVDGINGDQCRLRDRLAAHNMAPAIDLRQQLIAVERVPFFLWRPLFQDSHLSSVLFSDCLT